MLSLLFRRGTAGSSSSLRLLDDASEALQYNRDLLQSALDQVRHGLGVYDKDILYEAVRDSSCKTWLGATPQNRS